MQFTIAAGAASSGRLRLLQTTSNASQEEEALALPTGAAQVVFNYVSDLLNSSSVPGAVEVTASGSELLVLAVGECVALLPTVQGAVDQVVAFAADSFFRFFSIQSEPTCGFRFLDAPSPPPPSPPTPPTSPPPLFPPPYPSVPVSSPPLPFPAFPVAVGLAGLGSLAQEVEDDWSSGDASWVVMFVLVLLLLVFVCSPLAVFRISGGNMNVWLRLQARAPLLPYYSLLTTALLLTTHYCPTTHYSLLTTHCSPLTTHYSLLTTYHLLLTTHHALLTTYCSLLTTYCLLTSSAGLYTGVALQPCLPALLLVPRGAETDEAADGR